MPSRPAILIATLLIAVPQPAPAQEALSIAVRTSLHFEPWQPAPFGNGRAGVVKFLLESEDRKNRWLIPAAIGAAAGVVFCTAMSTLINDSASGGLSFCPLDSYLLIGGAGFLLGAAIGLAF